jgi:Mrp family chromosome partitioning ATPase
MNRDEKLGTKAATDMSSMQTKRVITITNRTGGSGQTTTSVNLGAQIEYLTGHAHQPEAHDA